MHEWDEVLLVGGPVLCTSVKEAQMRGGGTWEGKGEGELGRAVREELERRSRVEVTPFGELGECRGGQ